MRTKRRPGQPTKLTKELHREIVKWVEAGNYVEVAAQIAGIEKKSFYNWLKRGHKEKRGIHREFLHAIKAAEARAESRLLIYIEKAAAKQWQAAAWRLERKWPKRWGRKVAHTVEQPGNDGKKRVLRLTWSNMDNGSDDRDK